MHSGGVLRAREDGKRRTRGAGRRADSSGRGHGAQGQASSRREMLKRMVEASVSIEAVESRGASTGEAPPNASSESRTRAPKEEVR